MDLSGSSGASTYFGFGTAVFRGDHGGHLMEGLRLRAQLERSGLRLPKGMHAKNDSHATRDQVFDLMGRQAPRFDTTFLHRASAYGRVKAAGPTYLYKLAWYLHFRTIALQVSEPGDTLYVIAATLTTNRKAESARDALVDVCQQAAHDREIVLCMWDAASSWGVQVADYGLWAVQRTRGTALPLVRARCLPDAAVPVPALGSRPYRSLSASYPDLPGRGPLDPLSLALSVCPGRATECNECAQGQAGSPRQVARAGQTSRGTWPTRPHTRSPSASACSAASTTSERTPTALLRPPARRPSR